MPAVSASPQRKSSNTVFLEAILYYCIHDAKHCSFQNDHLVFVSFLSSPANRTDHIIFALNKFRFRRHVVLSMSGCSIWFIWFLLYQKICDGSFEVRYRSLPQMKPNCSWTVLKKEFLGNSWPAPPRVPKKIEKCGVTPQNVIITAKCNSSGVKCNTNAKCNNIDGRKM